ncbi:MAG: hypothetical protein KA369_13990 [Spirochaetes bacterium]|nr:hypothetical protein [Spirochaetota bacterium]
MAKLDIATIKLSGVIIPEDYVTQHKTVNLLLRLQKNNEKATHRVAFF